MLQSQWMDDTVEPLTPAGLIERRRALGLTQEQLAQRLGVHRVTLTRWESGVIPISYPRMVLALLEALLQQLSHDGKEVP